MHFLVRLNWSGGRILREYTALIDPPVYAAEVPSQISSPRIVSALEDLEDSNPPPPVIIDSIPLENSVVDSSPVPQSDVDEGTERLSSDSEAQKSADVEADQGEISVVYVEQEASIEQSADGSFATYGPTAEGDTLSDIASQFSAQFPDIDMYQVMYVLVRENLGAFIGGNMNLLMKGQILQLSDIGIVREVTSDDARSEFRAHLTRWDGYAQFAAQDNEAVLIPAGGDAAYAGDVDSMPGTGLEGSEEVAAGSADQIGAEAGDGGGTDVSAEPAAAIDSEVAALSAADEPASDEQFRIGSAGAFEGASDGQGLDAGDSDEEIFTLQGEVVELESALFSSNLENDDLRQRVAMLEDQLVDVNRLIELGDADLAALQATVSGSAIEEGGSAEDPGQFAAGPDSGDAEISTDAPVEAASVVEETGAAEDVAGQSSEALVDSEQAADSDDLAAEATAVAASATVTQAATMNSRSWWSRLVESLKGVSSLVMTLVGLFVVALAGLMFLRRKRAMEEFEHSMLSIGVDSITAPTQVSGDVEHIVVSEEETNTTRESSFLTVYSDSEVVVHADEVDPIAEADVYLAYGRDQQAEEVLIDGMSKFPDRDDIKLKLLTIYRKRKDVSAFETLAEELYPTDSAASKDTWELVARMGRKLSPDNPLFSDDPQGFGQAGSANARQGNTLQPDPDPADDTAMETDSGVIEFEPDIEEGAASLSEDTGETDGEEIEEEIGRGGDLPEELEFDLQDEMEKAGQGKQDLGLDTVAEEVTAVMNSLDMDADAGEDPEYELFVEAVDDKSELTDTEDAGQGIDLELDATEAEANEVSEEGKEVPEARTGNIPAGVSNERSEIIEFTPELTARREQLSGKNQAGSKEKMGSSDDPDATINEFETQIELARVFIELGDKDGARKILSEVINDGESDHRRTAEELMSAINE